MPSEFVQARAVERNENAATGLSNENVETQQNQNEVPMSDEESSSQAQAQSSSQEVQRNTVINNNVVSLCYDMDHRKRGLCLIFAHKMFNDKTIPERESALQEAERIESTFKRRGFRVIIRKDFTLQQINKELRELKDKVDRDDDCICICISSHGTGDQVMARNGKYEIDIIKNKLAKIPNLMGKPKLIFIQACRGENIDQGIDLNVRNPKAVDECDNVTTITKKIPSRADFLVVYSSPPGYKSFRNWFFQSLCENLDMYGDIDDMDEILRKTARHMCDKKSNCPDNIIENCGKQVPEIGSTLTKRLFLKRK